MRYRLSWFLLLCLVITVSSPTLASKSKLADTKLAFDHYQISAPFKVTLPIIVVDVVATEQFPADELVIIGEDEQNQTWLAVYVFHKNTDSFIMLDKFLLADKYFAFDVSDNKQGLYFLAKNEVVMLNYVSELNVADNVKSGLHFLHKQKVNSIFLLEKSEFIIKKDFIQDVNEDGVDDIILADFQQTNIWIGDKNNQNFLYQALAINAQVELMHDSVKFKPTKLFLADLNVDSRQDIAWISQGQLNYFRQIAQGKYATEPQTIALASSIYGLNWWQIKESDGQSLDQSDLVHRVVEQIKDINGDGLVDVIVRFTQSSGVLDRANNYEFYLGNQNEHGQLEFPKKPNTTIEADGTLSGLKIIDVNNDNKFEVLLSAFELSVSNIIGALLSGGIDQNVLLFSLNDNDVYEDDAIISKEVELSFSLTSGQSGQPIVLLTDVNGDSLQDLILSTDEDEIDIFLGQQSSRLFNRKASKHELLLPKNGELFKHHDINHDGKADFIMRYGRLDDKSMANKITILMVK